MWKDVYEPGATPPRLLFRYDPERGIIQLQRRGVKHVIDLAEYSAGSTSAAHAVVKQAVEIVERDFTTRSA